LYKIDCIIKEKKAEAIWKNTAKNKLANKNLIAQKLLYQYCKFADIFSKAVSDILLLYWKYNLKIKLEKDYKLGFSLLYQYSTEELRTCKQYLIENLNKGFIRQSQLLFAVSILFA